MPLHLVTQWEQPYTSVRQCCECCGRAAGPYAPGGIDRNHPWTDNQEEWVLAENNCERMRETSLLLCDGTPTVDQNEVYERNCVGRSSNYLPPTTDEDEDYGR